MELLPEKVTGEKRLYESDGIVSARNPSPAPLMELRLVGTAWHAHLNAPMTLEEWKRHRSKHGGSVPHNFGESEERYKARVLAIYSKYLSIALRKGGICVRAFMKATKTKRSSSGKAKRSAPKSHSASAG